jgi:tRNA uracil 4-sulfurtransferase
MMNPTVIIHYGEIALKGKNRGSFEKRLEENIRTAFRDSGLSIRVKRVDGRFLLRYSPRESAGIPDARRYVVHRLQSIPGITYFGFGYQVDRSIDEIIEASLELYKDVPAGSFKVDSRRADKSFKYTSPEINRLVGEAVVKRFDAPVDLNRPQNTIRIEIAYTGVYVFCNRHNGVGGLPVGSGGRVVSMLSAGYDSPVASYLLMKRGSAGPLYSLSQLPVRSAHVDRSGYKAGRKTGRLPGYLRLLYGSSCRNPEKNYDGLAVPSARATVPSCDDAARRAYRDVASM